MDYIVYFNTEENGEEITREAKFLEFVYEEDELEGFSSQNIPNYGKLDELQIVWIDGTKKVIHEDQVVRLKYGNWEKVNQEEMF